jgi:uncharacterized damage-inducible protein DinB
MPRSLTRCLVAAAITALGAASTASAQAPENPYTTAIRKQGDAIRDLVVRTAEKVPEDLYAFKPTPEVRSLGAILGHIADGNTLICTIAKGEKPVMSRANEQKTTRADLVAGLKASFAFCDEVFAATTDASGGAMVNLFGQQQPKLAVLAFNNSRM